MTAIRNPFNLYVHWEGFALPHLPQERVSRMRPRLAHLLPATSKGKRMAIKLPVKQDKKNATGKAAPKKRAPVKKATPIKITPKKKAPAKKETGKKLPGGSPTKYDVKFNKMAETACERLGATDKDLAALFNVGEKTIYNWKNEHSEFLQAIKRGKDVFDIAIAETCLKKRVTGYTYTEVTSERGKDGNLVVTKEVQKELAPDTTALIFFLKNRSKDRWRDKQDLDLNATGSLGEILSRIAGLNPDLPNQGIDTDE